jgi:hypothetical protein
VAQLAEATSRQVAGSIPDVVNWIFHLHNISGRSMALGSTQPLTEMSSRNTSWGVKAVGADCLEFWEPQLPGTFRAFPGL